MGGGKRRNTSKTGDKALYKQLEEQRAASKKKKGEIDIDDDKNDSMYTKVDRYHNEEDKNFIKLTNANNNDNDSDDDEDNRQEAVLNLGLGGGSSSSEDDDEDEEESSSDDDSDGGNKKQLAPSSSDDDDDDSDDDDDDDDEEIEDVRDWGKRKASYYHGDTADLELGQDEEDAFVEEEAAKEVLAARYKEMDEEDFMLSDDDDDEEKDQKKNKKLSAKKQDETEHSTSRLAAIRDVSKLSVKEQKKLLEKQHPGLLQILDHFSGPVRDLEERTSVATNALFGTDEYGDVAKEIGATKMGKKYLLTKALVQTSTALNLAMLLLLKSEEGAADSDDDDSDSDADDTRTPLMLDAGSSSTVQYHPVMKRLQELNVLNQKLKSKVEDNVDGLEEQLDSLVKAAKLMESMADGEDDEAEDEEEEGKEEAGDEAQSSSEEMDDTEAGNQKTLASSKQAIVEAEASSSSDSESSVDEEAIVKATMQNAKFGLRLSEVAQDKGGKGKRRRRAAPSDLGDDVEAVGKDNKGAARYLSSALNTIEQRAASKKKKRTAAPEDLVENDEAGDDLRRGLEMMEAELGKHASDNEVENGVDGIESDDEDEDGGFYAAMTKKSKAKKALKKSKYAVAPKFPRVDGEVEGERAINRTIMKNRGLVPHKNKLNRNPRVKKREQYRKALIKRKGAVREVRTDEGHRYGGEETGIKRGISRSRKLGA